MIGTFPLAFQYRSTAILIWRAFFQLPGTARALAQRGDNFEWRDVKPGKFFHEDTMEVQFKNRAGAALLEGAVAHFAVRVVDVYPAGDDALFVGQVVYFEHHQDKSLLFYAGEYQQLLTQLQ
jgi:flavin reductase (DIM6/NTAB) family NADH-FMN oxidoreductase RutF